MFFAKRFTMEAGILLGLCLLFFFLRFPSLFEPYWYGDEGIYFTVGNALQSGRELYTEIWDNKPPLLYWFYQGFNDLFSIRFVSLVFGLGAIIAFFHLARNVLTKKKLTYLTTLVFALLLGMPTIEGNIANAENFMLFPIVTAGFLFWYAETKQSRQNNRLRLLSGFLVGLAFLFKTVALFDLMAFLTCLLLLSGKKHHFRTSLKAAIIKSSSYGIGFLLPFFCISIYFLLSGNFIEFSETLFFKNVSYVSEKNHLIIPQGFLLLKIFLLITSLTFLFRFRKTLTEQELFVWAWVFFSLFNAFFSQRPYVHYQLVLLPSLILAGGIAFSHTAIMRKSMALLPVIGILYLLYITFPHWHTNRAVPYYQNFLSFMTGTKTFQQYRSYFDRNTPRDYAVASYVSRFTRPNEEIFLWGDSAQIYHLSDTLPAGRYAVSYHIVTRETIRETEAVLAANPPRHLIVMPTNRPIPFTLHNYHYKLTIGDTLIYERAD